MYVAGIYVSEERFRFSTEAMVCGTLAIFVAEMIRKIRRAFRVADDKGGKIKSMPTTLLGRVVTPLHGVAIAVPPFAYLLTVPLNGLKQPEWFAHLALPDFGLSGLSLGLLRVTGCVGLALASILTSYSLNTLGQSFHAIGVREKPKVVSSGLYGFVRHPLYSFALLQQVSFVLMFWNYVSFYALGVVVVAFGIKMPIEEGLIEQDEKVGAEYRAYKKQVTSRIIPGIW